MRRLLKINCSQKKLKYKKKKVIVIYYNELRIFMYRNPGESEHLWQPITSNEMNYLHITSKEDKLEKYLLKDKYEFLKNLQLIHSHSAESLPTLKDEL